MSEKGYVAFISYRHQLPDMEVAKKLHTAIETYRIPANIRKKTGRTKTGRVFRDQEELPLSSDLGQDIEDALDHSEWFIAVCSPRYQQSRWCMREMEYFIEKKGIDRVLTIVTEGEPGDVFPEILSFRKDEQGEMQPVEPLAADVRSSSLKNSLKKLRREKLRLLAPILSVTYDDLRLREKQRRKKRIAAIAVAAAMIGGILAGVLIRNARLREEAEKQQRIAEEQRQRAEEEQRKAEEERKRAEEEQRKAEEERNRAEEEQRKAEEERLNAVSNSIGESLQKAVSLRNGEERQRSATMLLEALDVSELNGGMRREEIIAELRRTMYIEPFSIVAKLDMQNMRLNNAVVSPDRTRAACIANGNAVAVIDLDKNQVLYTVSVDSEDISSICFSRDGSRFLAICSGYGCAAVWNTEDGSEVYRYTSDRDQEAMIANAAFWEGADSILVQDYDKFWLVSLPDGGKTLFYTIGDQQDGYRYDSNLLTMGVGKPINEIITEIADNYTRSAMMVSKDGTRVVIGGRDGKTGTIVLNDKGERIALLDRLPGTIMEYYDFSEDNRYVACRSMTGFLGLWETETGRLKLIHSLSTAFKEGVNAVTMTETVISPDSSMMAYVTDNTLVIEDLPKGKERVRIELEETEFPPRLSWSDDSRYLCFFNPSLYTVDARDGRVVLFRKAEVTDPFNNVLPVGDRMIFVTRGGGEAGCYSLPAGSSIRQAEDYAGGRTGYDPRYGDAEAWETPPQGEHHVPETFQTLLEMKDEPSEPYYSPDGRYAALQYPDGVIEVFRQEDSDRVYLMNNQYSTAPVAFGITGDIMCASDDKGRLLFQDLTDGTMTVLNTGSPRTVFMFDPAGELLMAVADNATDADVYDVRNAEKLFTVSGTTVLKAIGFSEDGELAVAYTADGKYITAELWRDETKLLEAARRLAP